MYFDIEKAFLRIENLNFLVAMGWKSKIKNFMSSYFREAIQSGFIIKFGIVRRITIDTHGEIKIFTTYEMRIIENVVYSYRIPLNQIQFNILYGRMNPDSFGKAISQNITECRHIANEFAIATIHSFSQH